jgi:type I restriction enzyme, S subunit
VSVVLSEHLPLLASAPDGIQKLRGLILELAVRGKLVPQDANDEPASELLKRIKKERARLETKGLFRKSKPGTLIGKDCELLELPIGWVQVRLSDLGEFKSGKTPSTNNETYWHGAIPWVSPKDMKALTVAATEDYVTDKAVANGLALIPENSVLIVVRSGILRRTVPVAINSVPCTVNQDLKALSLAIPDTAQYVQLLVRGFERLILTTLTKVGTTVESIKFDEFLLQAFPLPPLAEQHRIVAKVDELMALCDRLESEQADAGAAHAKLVTTLLGTLAQSTNAAELTVNWQRLAEHFDTLFTTEASLDALKQTILQLAVMGKLVPQDPNDEPVSELLKRISKERVRLEAEGTCKKSKPMPPADGDAFYSLPNPWNWSALDSLVRVMDSGWSPACIETPSPRNDVWGVLKTTAVQTFQYLEYENKELPAHLKPRPECEVAAGDILITRAGPKNRVAISCLVEATRPLLMISDKIIRFHLVEGGMYEKFVALCLNAGATAAYLENAKSGMAASQMNITQEKLRAAPIPICPTSEQHRIVAKVDELMALCDRLKTDLAESRTRQDRLATTLIKTALKAA